MIEHSTKGPAKLEQLALKNARVLRDDVQQLERLLTVEQVAKHWQLSPRTVWRMIKLGRLPVSRFGRAVRIHPKVVAKLDSEGIV
jgi:excisionase family DNA binding protein